MVSSLGYYHLVIFLYIDLSCRWLFPMRKVKIDVIRKACQTKIGYSFLTHFVLHIMLLHHCCFYHLTGFLQVFNTFLFLLFSTKMVAQNFVVDLNKPLVFQVHAPLKFLFQKCSPCPVIH
jgi:hypothetical protein